MVAFNLVKTGSAFRANTSNESRIVSIPGTSSIRSFLRSLDKPDIIYMCNMDTYCAFAVHHQSQ